MMDNNSGILVDGWMPKTQPWIVCAANRYGDIIITGARHHDRIMRMAVKAIGGGFSTDTERNIGAWKKGFEALSRRGREEQGFIDQFGRFYSREDAMRLALQNGQLEAQRAGKNCDSLLGVGLLSEDLY
jgi:hypothetical protein